MDNHAYDIVKALTKKADAIWVYEQYLKDTKSCPSCQKTWARLKEEEEKQLKLLKNLLASHRQDVTASSIAA